MVHSAVYNNWFFGEGEICLVLKRGNWTSFIGMTQMVFAILAYTSCLSCEFRISGQQPPFYKELPSCWHVIMWLTYKLYMNTIMESCSHWWIIGKIGSSSNDHQSLIANSFFHASTSIEWFDLKKSSFHHHFDHFEGFCQTNIKDFSFWWLSLLIACPFVKQVIFHETFALFWTL